jgi:hypothetical protein
MPVRSGGAMARDVRLTLCTDDGAVGHMTYGGRWIAPPSCGPTSPMPSGDIRSILRVTAFGQILLFETGAGQYAWLRDIVCIGQGYLIEGGIL